MLKGFKLGVFAILTSLAITGWAAANNTDNSSSEKPVITGQKLGFISSNPITFQQLKTKKALVPQPVWGYLNMPTFETKQKVPAVVMMAGAGGLAPWYNKYVRALNAQGIATFQVDSFTPRGLGGVADNQAQLPVPMIVADAYSALQYLAKEPNIDASKIAIMGWSLGGLVSITTAFTDLNDAVVNKPLHFAAHITFYPACNLIYPNDHLDGAPWLYLHGGADDYTQPTDCLNVIAKLRNSAVINAVFYPNAQHAFDNPRSVEWLSDVQNPKNCHGVLAQDWSMSEQTTGAAINAPADYEKAYAGCMLRGAHLGFNKPASEDAMWQVTNFLQHYLLKQSTVVKQSTQ
jgi:dienelactone hydrolase